MLYIYAIKFNVMRLLKFFGNNASVGTRTRYGIFLYHSHQAEAVMCPCKLHSSVDTYGDSKFPHMERIFLFQSHVLICTVPRHYPTE